MPSIRIEDYLKRGVTHRALPDPTVPIVGPKGDQGASGRDGMNGRDGKDGRAGRDGRDGKDGRGLNWRGNWTEEQQYYADDVVNYLGSSYVATQDNKLDYPNRVNNAWDLMAASGAGGARGPQGEAGPSIGVPTFIQDDEPDYTDGPYVWVQTGLGDDGCQHTVWYKTC